MNITPHFVFIHMPKTGGTFVSKVLRQIYGTGRWHEFVLRDERLLAASNRVSRWVQGRKMVYEEFNKHGTCHEIPPRAAHLPILSCVRNPFDWYVSNYKYAWWRTHPDRYPGLRTDPRWPDLSFSDYLDLSNSAWLSLLNPGTEVNPAFGRLTVLFVNYYCRQPKALLSLPNDESFIQAVLADLMPVHFLDTGHLNRGLYDYLLATGHYPADTLAFILEKEKVSPRNQRKADEAWPQFYTPDQIVEMRQRDRLLFYLFPHFSESSTQPV